MVQVLYRQSDIPAAAEMLFFGPLGGMSMLCILRPRRPSLNATVPVSPFAPENSPPDCFLNAAHPLRVRIPPPNSIKNTPDLQNRNLLRYPAAPRADIYETAERNARRALYRLKLYRHYGVVGSAFFINIVKNDYQTLNLNRTISPFCIT